MLHPFAWRQLGVPTPGNAVPLEVTFDGRTSDSGGSGRAGGGMVSGVEVSCPATPPGAPYVIGASSGPEDGAILLHLRSATPYAHQVWSPVTGWEVSLDGGASWAALPTIAQPDGTQRATLRGLANGTYRVAIRATNAAGPSAPTDVRDIRLVGTPTDIAITQLLVEAGVSSLGVSWTPPEGEIIGGYFAESYAAAQQGQGTRSRTVGRPWTCTAASCRQNRAAPTASSAVAATTRAAIEALWVAVGIALLCAAASPTAFSHERRLVERLQAQLTGGSLAG